MANIVAAVVTKAFLAIGFSASVATIAANVLVAYAASAILGKPKGASGIPEDASREQELTGGDSVEKVIYGRAKVAGTRYMLQKVNAYLLMPFVPSVAVYEPLIINNKDDEVESAGGRDLFKDGDLIKANGLTQEWGRSMTTAASTYYVYFVVRLADGSAPTIGTTTSTGDFCITVNAAISTTNTISSLGNGYYWVRGQGTGSASISNHYGITRYSGQSSQDIYVSSLMVVTHSNGNYQRHTYDFIYHGLALCRHPCEGIEEVYFDDKPYYHSDFSDIEFSIRTIDWTSTAGAGTFQILLYYDAPLFYQVTIDATGMTVNELAQAAADAINSDGATSYYFKASVDESDLSKTIIERHRGDFDHWDFSISFNNVTGTLPSNTLGQTAGQEATQLYFRLHYQLGDQTTASPVLTGELDNERATQRWTSSHIGNGITHINVRWEASWLKENLGRLPQVTVVLKGKNDIYDPRTGSSGYTDNAALCIRDYLTQDYAYSATSAQLPNAEWNAAANVCDENVNITAGLTQKRYVFNGVLNLGVKPRDNLGLMADAIQAPVVWSQGEYIIKPAQWEAASYELNESHLAGNIIYQDKASIQDHYNVIAGTFIDPEQEWGLTDYPAVSVNDGLQESIGTLSFAGEIDYIRAQRLAKLNMLLNYEAAPVEVPIKRLNEYITVGDIISLSIDSLNWSSKTFYVAERKDNADATAVLILLPRESSMFAWDYTTDYQDMDSITSEPIFTLTG